MAANGMYLEPSTVIRHVYTFVTNANSSSAIINKQTKIMNMYTENIIEVLKVPSSYLINKHLST